MLNKFLVAVVLIGVLTAVDLGQTVSRPAAAPSALISALKGTDPDARRDAATRLGGLRARDAVRPLIEALADKDAGVREAAAFALGQITDRRATDALIGALKDKNDEVRATIAFSIGMLGDRKSIKVLSNLLADGAAEVRAAATVGLGLMQDDEAVDEIVDMLNDPSIDVRYDAVWALAQIDEPDAIDHLKAVLVNLDLVKVDAAALEGLRQAVQSAMETLEAKRQIRSLRKRRANEPPPKATEKVTYSMDLQAAKIIQSVQAAPTARALRSKIHGAVGVRVLIAATGRAARAYVTKRLGSGLDQRAVEAAMQYTFQPSMLSGFPQTTWMDIDIRF